MKGASWILLSLLSALAAGGTAVLSKAGLEKVDSALGLAVQSVLILGISWGVVLFQGRADEVTRFDGRTWAFLLAAGVVTTLAYLAYFAALKAGDAARVAPVDRLSLVFAMVLAAVLLKERPGMQVWLGAGLMAVGAVVVATAKPAPSGREAKPAQSSSAPTETEHAHNRLHLLRSGKEAGEENNVMSAKAAERDHSPGKTGTGEEEGRLPSDELRDSPTMDRLLGALEAGDDVGHYGRLVFAMVGRHFLPEEELVRLLAAQPDESEERARAMVMQVQGRDYNPPKRERLLEWQSQQDFQLVDPDNPDSGNLYREIRFPEGVYENIQEYYEEKAA